MPEWIKATRESAGYYADDPPQRPPYPPTCRERQDEAIAKLAATLDLTLGICEAIGSELAELRARVVALEADAQADVRFVLLELVRDDGAEDELDDQCAAYERIPQSLDRSNTNQTYSWLPGDALSQYCAEVDGADDPQLVRVLKLGYLDAEKRIPQPPGMVAMIPLPDGGMMYEEETP